MYCHSSCRAAAIHLISTPTRHDLLSSNTTYNPVYPQLFNTTTTKQTKRKYIPIPEPPTCISTHTPHPMMIDWRIREIAAASTGAASLRPSHQSSRPAWVASSLHG
ncbi:hypothetical protein PVAG01_02369 [Phlyctema vagabunda]|uniref:Uncharacterized protein n=1 Tax=Phlyctema vagabunda TaxID=108571 RepID=A0ABR4PQG1_9HELO